MSECIEKLRGIVKQFKAKAIDKEAFRDQVFNTLVEHISDPFAEADVNIIIKLLDQMKKLGVADAETCDEIGSHFRSKAGMAAPVRQIPDVPEPTPPAPEQAPPLQAPPPPRPAGKAPETHAMPTSHGGLPPYAGDMSETITAESGLPAPPVGGVAPDPSMNRMAEKGAEVQSLKNLTKWFTILLPGSLLLSFVPVVNLFAAFVMLAGGIMGLMVLYACWHHVQDGKARTSPLMAVGLLFVPLFNMYWIFVAFGGLAKEIRRRLLELGGGARPPKAALSSLFCILTLLYSLLPLAMAGMAFGGMGMLMGGGDASSMQVFGGLMGILGLVVAVVAIAVFVLYILMMRDFSRAVTPVILKSDRVSKPRWGKFVMLIGGIFLLSLLIAAGAAFAMGGMLMALFGQGMGAQPYTY